jgi:hypothetical protein
VTGDRFGDTVEARAPAARRRAVSSYDVSEEGAEDDEPVDLADSVAPLAALSPAVFVDSPASFVDSPASFDVDVDGLDVVRASFFAQPEPLKTTAAANTALRRGPPQTVQVVGPGALTPWITSTIWPQSRQT